MPLLSLVGVPGRDRPAIRPSLHLLTGLYGRLHWSYADGTRFSVKLIPSLTRILLVLVIVYHEDAADPTIPLESRGFRTADEIGLTLNARLGGNRIEGETVTGYVWRLRKQITDCHEGLKRTSRTRLELPDLLPHEDGEGYGIGKCGLLVTGQKKVHI